MSTRVLLGKARSLGSRATIYEAEDGLEIEVNEQYDVTQKRVLYDDVLMVTIHRETGLSFLVITGLWAAFFILIGSLILSISADVWPVSAVFYVIALPAVLGFFQRLFFGIDVVTVFGRRSKTAMRFAFRKRRARLVYAGICTAVQNAHNAAMPVAATPAEPSVQEEQQHEQREDG